MRTLKASLACLALSALLVTSCVSTPVSAASPPAGKVCLGYWALWGDDPKPRSSLESNLDRIDLFSPYWYTLLGDGTLRSRETGHAALTQLVHSRGGRVIPLINKTSDHTPLLDPTVRRRAVDNIVRMLVSGGYDGVNIDFEGMPPYTRAGLTAFMQELSTKMREAGLLVTMAVPAKWSSDDSVNSFAACFDYTALGKLVDYLVIMTYDQHGGWSGPGPVAAYDWTESVVRYAVSVVDPTKILLGLAGYGYDWSWNGCTAVEAVKAPSLAARYGATIQWDDSAQCPRFVYYDSWGTRHEVWYENSYSVDLKLRLVQQYGLGGAALWALGQEDSRFWSVLRGDAGVSGGLGGRRSATGFADVPPSHWAYDTITRLRTEGVIGGVDGSAFQPDRTVTRAEFAALLAKALKLPTPGSSAPRFVDVSLTDWFYDAVLRVAAAGLMRGVGDGRFAPGLALDREAAAVVAGILGAARPPSVDGVTYSDLDEASEWALQAIVEAARRGLLRGYPDGTFQPHRGLTRAEAAVLVLRLRP